MPTDHIQYRNMLMQVVLAIVTLGIYGIYWFYVTLRELHTANGKEASSGRWTVLALVPVAGLFANWHYSSEYAQFVNDRYPALVMFLAWIIFFPIVWFLVQTELNKAATGAADSRPRYTT